MKLPEFAVKQPVATLMLFLAIFLLGIFSLVKLNVDMFPEIDPPVISVLTAWYGASASDVETEVTEPLEDVLNSINNLDTLSSKSLDNLSIVSCKFDWGTELNEASNDIREVLEFAKRELPEDVEPPILFKFNSSVAPIIILTVTAEKNWTRLYHLVDKKISDELKRISGVGAVLIYGGLKRRINILFDKDKIEGFNLSLHRINQTLAAENLNVPAGRIKAGLKDYFVRIPARYQSMQQIKDTVIGYFNKHPVYLKDVAEVKDGFESVDMLGWGDGVKGVVVTIQKQTGKNTINIIRKINKRLNKIRKNLPSDVTINIVKNDSDDIMLSIINLQTSLFWGMFFIIIVTIVFLRKVRTVFIIATTIPASLIVTFIFLYICDFTINVMSLMALAIAAGLVVDNAIVVLENIIRHVEKGETVKTSAMFGASEMGLAISASTLTSVVVFMPLIFLSGIAGMFLRQLGLILALSLVASLFTSLMLTPMLATKLVSSSKNSKNKNKFIAWFYKLVENSLKKLEYVYKKLLNWALMNLLTVIILAVMIFVSSISLLPFISTSLFPVVDTGDVWIRFRMAEGTRIEETTKIIESIYKEFDKLVRPEEIRHSYATCGETKEGVATAIGLDEGPNVGSLTFKLVDRNKRNRSAEDIASILRKRVSKIPGITKITVSSRNVLTGALLGGGKPISLEIQGTDLEQNFMIAQKIKKIMNKIPGLVDIDISQKDLRPELWVEVDRGKATDLGLNIAIIAGTLRNYFYGVEASKFRDSGDRFDIFSCFSEKDKNNLENLLNAPIFTPTGKMIRLNNIARIVEGKGPVEIERKNRFRIIKVEGDTFNRSIGAVTKDLKKALKNLELPPGLNIKHGGEVDEQRKTFLDLTVFLVIGIMLVYMLMASLFASFKDPLIVMFSVPFAFTGVIYIYYFTGTSFGIMCFMASILLVGIVVNNAIVLIDYIHLLQKRGRSLKDAVVEGCTNRLRPVLMTTFTTFFAMLPVAVSDSVGAEAWNPLGITMLGGLSVSTLVTLFLIPTIYYLSERRKEG